MIIDFHTHIFPDKVAIKAIPLLAEKGKLKPYTDGTYSGLSSITKKANMDYSIALPVATSPKQVVSINDYAIQINKEKTNVISFGAMHPDFMDFENELIRLKENGIKGIKLHPAYQNVYINDERYIKIIDKAFSLGLIVIIHAGIDIGIPGEVMASPERIIDCKNQLTHNGIFVLAHMGSWNQWDVVYDKILGKDFYIDTAFSLGHVEHGIEDIKLMDYSMLEKFILKHGSDKILFGSDCPWANPKEYIDFLLNSPLKQEDIYNILGLNAKRILKL